MNLSLDASILRNRINVGVDYYRGRSKDVIMNISKSAVYGTSAYYANVSKIDNNGVELSLQASLVRLRDFEWIVGGNISFMESKIKSLGGKEQEVIEYEDGSMLVSRVEVIHMSFTDFRQRVFTPLSRRQKRQHC